MDKRYFDYCQADRYFYDTPLNVAGAPDFELASRSLPRGWHQRRQQGWLVYARDKRPVPSQGWKVHVSACLGNADEILAAVWDYCVPREIGFKHLAGLHVFVQNNGKYGARGSSGKLVTIYPADEAQLRQVLEELGAILVGQPGPYILSDLRWGSGPLYVRYGGFALRHCLSETGELVPAIEDGDGNLVPDKREPSFRVPPWVTLPAFLAPHLEARNKVTVTDIPYTIERALHFSNGGGVYEGKDKRTGERVVLKEARPYAGLDGLGGDAVSRLRREHMIMQHLAGLPCVPAVHDYLIVGDHHFLVQGFVEGVPLNAEYAKRLPKNRAGEEGGEAITEFRAWALEILRHTEAAIAALHERGVVYGDLHQFNLMVRPDGGVTLIDFEVAALVEEGLRQGLGNPGFTAPRDRLGFARDRYALACLKVSLFLPLTTLFPLDPGKPAHLAKVIHSSYRLPKGYLDAAVREIAGEASGELTVPGTDEAVLKGTALDRPELWEPTRRALTESILASATLDRDDRLFPGDVEQFGTGGLNIAHGAAGVLFALAEAGSGRFPEHEEWLIAKTGTPDPRARLGLYDGMFGAAYVLDSLGHRAEALKIVDVCLGEKWTRTGIDLHGGLAGMALCLDHFAAATGDPSLRDAATRAVGLMAERLGDVDSVAEVSGGAHPYAGLMRGSSGPALAFIRCYERSGDAGLLDLAATALRQDLRRCVIQADGSMQVNEGRRSMPYLGVGSVGIGLILREYLEHRPDEEFAAALEQIGHAACLSIYVFSGVFNGRAGMILYLSQLARPDDAVRQIRNLAWHAVNHEGRLAFPGDQLYRLSMDFATGAAGVLHALACAVGPARTLLPFLPRRRA